MRTGKATGCFVLLAAGCLGQWDWMLPVASPGARAKFVCCDGVARGSFYLGYRFQTCSLAPFFRLLAVFCLGFFAVAGKAYYVAASTLTYRFYGEIEGRIIGVDRARSGAVRVTLDQVELENISKSNTPQKVRLSISGGSAAQLLTPQGRLKTKGFLMPPPGPSEPGGFDFRRYAWFRGLGIVGVVVAFMGWHASVRPDILIAKDGVLVGLLLPEGRALSEPSGGTFSARIWAQNDGRPMPREKAYALWKDRKGDLYHHWSKKMKGLEIMCGQGEIHILAQQRRISGECWHLSHRKIKRNGATAIWLDKQGKPAKIRHINSGFARLWSKHR